MCVPWHMNVCQSKLKKTKAPSSSPTPLPGPSYYLNNPDYIYEEMLQKKCPLSYSFCQELVPVTTIVTVDITFDLYGSSTKGVQDIVIENIADTLKQSVIENGAAPDTVDVDVIIDRSCELLSVSIRHCFYFRLKRLPGLFEVRIPLSRSLLCSPFPNNVKISNNTPYLL